MYPARRVPQAMLMGLLLPLAGCRMLAAPFLLWSPEPTKEVQAVYAYLPDKKVCTLIWVEADTLFEYPNVQLELSEFLNNSLKPQIRGISFVPPRRVVEYQRRNPDWKREHPTAIGVRFGADRVLMVEITRYTTREPDSPHLYRGHIHANVKVYVPSSPNSLPVNDRIEIETAFPPEGAGEWGSTDRSIRRSTMEAFAAETARKFYDHKIKVR